MMLAIGSHPHIVKLIAQVIASSPEKDGLLLEYCNGCTLLQFVEEKRPIDSRWYRQLLEAVAYMHQKGIYHRDLKPENVLLQNVRSCCNQKIVKLADFGLSGKEQNSPKLSGTIEYSAPEVLDKVMQRYSDELSHAKSSALDWEKIDIWCLGLLWHFIFKKEEPFMFSDDMWSARKKMRLQCLKKQHNKFFNLGGGLYNLNVTLKKSASIKGSDQKSAQALMALLGPNGFSKILSRDPLQRPTAAALQGCEEAKKSGATNTGARKF